MYQIGEDFWRKITPWTEEPDQPQSSLVPQTVKTSLAMWETCVQSLGQEDSLEKKLATHSNILAWKFHRQGSLAIVHGIAKTSSSLLLDQN